MIGKPDVNALERSLPALRKFVLQPDSGWERTEAGVFTIFSLPGFDIARWLGERTGLHRAFRGVDAPETVERIARALRRATEVVTAYGIPAPLPGDESSLVILWDADLDLPERFESRGSGPQMKYVGGRRQRLTAPLTKVFLDDSSPPMVVLPTANRARDRARTLEWLEASAVHEGFHVLLRRWLGSKQAGAIFKSLAWQKMEEMCAVWLETEAYPGNRAHLDYGRAWLATLMLAHGGEITASAPYSWTGYDEDHEDYPHYALLSVLDRRAKRGGGQVTHWLREFWERARHAQVTDSPWEILDAVTAKSGGLGDAFEEAMTETMIGADGHGIIPQILAEFGPPATTILHGVGRWEELRIPPLAGHVFQVEPEKGSLEVVIHVEGKPDDLQQLRMWRWHPSSAPSRIEGGKEFRRTHDGKMWTEWHMRAGPAESVRIMVCYAKVNGGVVTVRIDRSLADARA